MGIEVRRLPSHRCPVRFAFPAPRKVTQRGLETEADSVHRRQLVIQGPERQLADENPTHGERAAKVRRRRRGAVIGTQEKQPDREPPGEIPACPRVLWKSFQPRRPRRRLRGNDDRADSLASAIAPPGARQRVEREDRQSASKPREQSLRDTSV